MSYVLRLRALGATMVHSDQQTLVVESANYIEGLQRQIDSLLEHRRELQEQLEFVSLSLSQSRDELKDVREWLKTFMFHVRKLISPEDT